MSKRRRILGNSSRKGRDTAPSRSRSWITILPIKLREPSFPTVFMMDSKNIGYMILSTSRDTSEFACACVQRWWENDGREQYPNATSIFILSDGGGSNSSRTYLF